LKILAEFPEPKGQVIYEGDFIEVNPRAAILWDTSKDGPLPEGIEAKVGYLKREGNALVEDAEKKAAHEAKLADKAAKDKEKDDRKAALDVIDHTKKLSETDLDFAVRAWLAERKGL
jgi:hypothetical protein